MSNLYLWPVKLLGWGAAGMALGVGWKLGNFVYEKLGEEGIKWPGCSDSSEQIWKRKFDKVS